MLDQILNSNVDVAREVLARIDALASAILAPGDVKLVLAIVVGFVVVVEWAHEHLLQAVVFVFCHSDLLIDCGLF